jgi:hypothetical protein
MIFSLTMQNSIIYPTIMFKVINKISLILACPARIKYSGGFMKLTKYAQRQFYAGCGL